MYNVRAQVSTKAFGLMTRNLEVQMQYILICSVSQTCFLRITNNVDKLFPYYIPS